MQVKTALTLGLALATDGVSVCQVHDSSMPLLGETQEEDRRIICDLIVAKMEAMCKPVQTTFK